MAANRVSAIARIRARQHRIAQVRLARADAAAQAIAATSAQVRGFRADYAMGQRGAVGHEFCVAGEFGLRLDAVEAALAARSACADAERSDAAAAALAAWQDHRTVATVGDRLEKQEAKAAAAHLSARFIQWRPARKALT